MGSLVRPQGHSRCHSPTRVGKEEAAQEQSYRIWFFFRSFGIDGLAFFLQRALLSSPIASSRLTNGCGRNFKSLFDGPSRFNDADINFMEVDHALLKGVFESTTFFNPSFFLFLISVPNSASPSSCYVWEWIFPKLFCTFWKWWK